LNLKQTGLVGDNSMDRWTFVSIETFHGDTPWLPEQRPNPRLDAHRHRPGPRIFDECHVNASKQCLCLCYFTRTVLLALVGGRDDNTVTVEVKDATSRRWDDRGRFKGYGCKVCQLRL
jgi:hypothetical protein